jgi:hypothetical protein
MEFIIVYFPNPFPHYRPLLPNILDIILFEWGVVIKALRYKPVGREFDSRWYHWNFSVT